MVTSSAPETAPGARRTRERVAVVLALVFLAAGVFAVHALGSRPPAWYPPCGFHTLTGLHCPGCGTARATHALAQGDVVRAADQNLLAVAMLPVLVAWAAITARRVWAGAPFSAALPGGWAVAVLVAVVIFAVLRNLPWWPFSVLGPD